MGRVCLLPPPRGTAVSLHTFPMVHPCHIPILPRQTHNYHQLLQDLLLYPHAGRDPPSGRCTHPAPRTGRSLSHHFATPAPPGTSSSCSWRGRCDEERFHHLCPSHLQKSLMGIAGFLHSQEHGWGKGLQHCRGGLPQGVLPSNTQSVLLPAPQLGSCGVFTSGDTAVTPLGVAGSDCQRQCQQLLSSGSNHRCWEVPSGWLPALSRSQSAAVCQLLGRLLGD